MAQVAQAGQMTGTIVDMIRDVEEAHLYGSVAVLTPLTLVDGDYVPVRVDSIGQMLATSEDAATVRFVNQADVDQAVGG